MLATIVRIGEYVSDHTLQNLLAYCLISSLSKAQIVSEKRIDFASRDIRPFARACGEPRGALVSQIFPSKDQEIKNTREEFTSGVVLQKTEMIETLRASVRIAELVFVD
jgi:hypothetical protein